MALNTKFYFDLVKKTDFIRVAELSQRTNKCTIGIRYNVGELEYLSSLDDFHLYVVSVTDRFSIWV